MANHLNKVSDPKMGNYIIYVVSEQRQEVENIPTYYLYDTGLEGRLQV